MPANPIIRGNMIRVGVGNPSIYTNNLDCLCFNLSKDAVSMEREWLADTERDETGGLQTLYCIFGDQSEVRPQSVPFTDEESEKLVNTAKEKSFENAADMTDDEILSTYSSTPAFEVPWFCDTIRSAAQYVANKINSLAAV